MLSTSDSFAQGTKIRTLDTLNSSVNSYMYVPLILFFLFFLNPNSNATLPLLIPYNFSFLFSSYKQKSMRRLASSQNLSLNILLLLMLRFWFLHNKQFAQSVNVILDWWYDVFSVIRWIVVPVMVIYCNSGFDQHYTTFLLSRCPLFCHCCLLVISPFN